MSAKPSVMLDPGHGGKDPGAVGPTGLMEKTVALTVCQLSASILIGAGVDVLFTRKDDTFIELPDRARLANAAGVDAFVSIHCNSASTPARGFEVFTTPGQTRADVLATEVFKSFGAEFPTATKRLDSSDGDPDKEANFAVLRLTQAPAVLFELDFISTPNGEQFLRDASNQLRCARAIASGVLAFLCMPSPAVLEVTEDGEDLRSRFERLASELARYFEIQLTQLELLNRALDDQLARTTAFRARMNDLIGGKDQ